MKNTAKKIFDILDEEIKILENDSKRVLIGGISQGCAMALYCGLSYDRPLGGIFGLSGFHINETELNSSNFNTP